MLIGKKEVSRLKLKNNNSNKMNTILGIVINKILRQNSGCVIDGYGVAYINYKDHTRDPIGHLLNYSDIKGYWGVISDEAQKPLVAKIRNRFGINISHYSEYERLVNFLQSIQDAHDTAFDCYNNHIVDNHGKMKLFLDDCYKIKMEFRL